MTEAPKNIIGSGGGSPPPPPQPTRTPDTLHSRSFATVQDLISEGEIEGFASAGKLAKGLVYLGASLALQGVSEMLFPMPKPKEFKSEQDPQLSFSFSGTQNTSRAGTPVPIVYGEIVTGSVVISGAIDTQQVQA